MKLPYTSIDSCRIKTEVVSNILEQHCYMWILNLDYIKTWLAFWYTNFQLLIFACLLISTATSWQKKLTLDAKGCIIFCRANLQDFCQVIMATNDVCEISTIMWLLRSRGVNFNKRTVTASYRRKNLAIYMSSCLFSFCYWQHFSLN